MHVARLELEVADLGTDPGNTPAERFQRRRTRLRSIEVRAGASALALRVADIRKHLAGLGITQLAARMCDNFVSVRARAADGLAAADVSFRIVLANAGVNLRALASAVRVHGHVPTPGPVIADRILGALLGATEAAGVVERPRTRGLCDVEVDLIGVLLWNLMPPSGWRLPAVGDLELVNVKIGRGGIDIGYGPAGSRSAASRSASASDGGGVRPQAIQLAAAHDLMHSADQQVRDGHLEDAMRGYRALLAAGGPGSAAAARAHPRAGGGEATVVLRRPRAVAAGAGPVAELPTRPRRAGLDHARPGRRARGGEPPRPARPARQRRW